MHACAETSTRTKPSQTARVLRILVPMCVVVFRDFIYGAASGDDAWRQTSGGAGGPSIPRPATTKSATAAAAAPTWP